MSPPPLIGALVLLLGHSAHAYQEAHELNVRNWDAKVREGTWLIKFYAPWCGHCKKMAPVFEEVAEHFHRRGDGVRVGRLDAQAHPGLLTPFDVKGYPTLLLLRDGVQVAEFKGARTFEAISAFVESASRAPAPSAPAGARPHAATRGASGRGALAWREALRRRLAWWSSYLFELDSFDAGILFLGTFATLGAAFMLMLAATTSASPR